MATPDTTADVRCVYDAVAESYAAVLPDLRFESVADRALLDDFVARTRALPRRQVIDAGCGAGRISAYLNEAGVDVTGVDLSPGMVRAAQRLHPGLSFKVGELARLPADDAAADGILAWYSIIHSSPALLPVIAGEFWRVLSPGGSALVAFHVGDGHRVSHRAYGHDVDLRTELHQPGDVELRFRQQGFVPAARLVREARATERHPQAALLLVKPPAPAAGQQREGLGRRGKVAPEDSFPAPAHF